MSRSLSAVAREVKGRLIGPDAEFGGVTTDTRMLVPGSLFVALAGDRFDGNNFVPKAHAQGAAGALVSRPADVPLPQIEVADTRRAFGAMAHAWRQGFSIPVVAVTGSAGKTTVKELIASVLGLRHRVCVTEGNLNNDVGLPLTLMRLAAGDEVLIVELGANHAGEIDYLAALAAPTIGVITNAGPAHLEGFGTVAGVAAAKGELLEHLPRAGTSVLNADDPFYPDWRARARTEDVVSFGRSATADCRLIGEPDFGSSSTRFLLALSGGAQLEVESPLLGMVNVINALAAAAAAEAAGAAPDEIRDGLARTMPVRGRLTALPGRNGATIVDDSYNANPAAARASLDFLRRRSGKRVFVLGDMLELGPEAPELHRQVGEYARDCCDCFFGFGELTGHATRGFGDGAEHFTDLVALEARVSEALDEGVTVLVKGSRSMGLERLVAALVEPDESGAARC